MELKQSIQNQVIGWLSFEFLDFSETGKTEIWTVYHKDSRVELGEIRWNGAWRQYWIEIVDAGFTRGCLRSSAEFIDKLMDVRK